MSGFNPEGWNENLKRCNYTLAELNEAKALKNVLESQVTMCDAGHNLIVDLGCMKGIIPRAEGAIGISDGTTRDIALITRVGKPVCFTVEGIETDSYGVPFAMLSRRNAQLLCREHIYNSHRPGDIIKAKITHLESFGAFCDIGCGNIALLPIDSISVSRISHPKDRFITGENIRAVIKSIAPDGKITLSHKELLGTWKENAALFTPGQTIKVVPGQQASVYIKSIIPEKMKIKLIIIDSFEGSYSPEIKYFYDGDNIEEWDYSPTICTKHISTRFCS